MKFWKMCRNQPEKNLKIREINHENTKEIEKKTKIKSKLWKFENNLNSEKSESASWNFKIPKSKSFQIQLNTEKVVWNMKIMSQNSKIYRKS